MKRSIKHTDGAASCACSCCLKVENLSIRRGEDVILEDVSFHMHCGELIALIGPNGAGKSSLFKSILGQMEHTGRITFQSASGEVRKPRIGYVPQSPAFDAGDPISVLDLFTAAVSRRPVVLPVSARLRARITDCLARTGAAELLHRRVGSLSGGELQRVLLAMALEPLPDILILDEPTSGVDAQGERQLLQLLDSIRTEYDLSILLSTHDFDTLQQADKVLLLRQRLLKQGAAEEVLSSAEFHRLFPTSRVRGGDFA